MWSEHGFYCNSRKADATKALPERCTLLAPPVAVGDEVVMWDADGWVVLPEAPPLPPGNDPEPEVVVDPE